MFESCLKMCTHILFIYFMVTSHHFLEFLGIFTLIKAILQVGGNEHNVLGHKVMAWWPCFSD